MNTDLVNQIRAILYTVENLSSLEFTVSKSFGNLVFTLKKINASKEFFSFHHRKVRCLPKEFETLLMNNPEWIKRFLMEVNLKIKDIEQLDLAIKEIHKLDLEDLGFHYVRDN